MGNLKKRPVKEENALVDLNVNPCKMCMPMGSATAAYGIEGCTTILHGSQGCATYIRRHMATHYNEPVDIASSALTEEGTVMGGEANLHKGIDNMIRLYDPRVICVSTTCLAETIGEDVPGMLDRWREAHPDNTVTFVPVASPGYGGSQFEGHFRFVRALVESVEMKPETALPHQLNVVCGPMSPADMRYLRELIALFNINAVIVPDLSESLDRPRLNVYDRTPHGGTTIECVASMAGSALTIELSTFMPEGCSTGKYLEENYNVPFIRLNMPVGLRDIDILIDELAAFAGVSIPHKLQVERGRYLDAMIDSHKYNAEGRAVVFGEPDFCTSVVRLCVENGIVPVVVAAGSACRTFSETLEGEVGDVARRFLVENWKVFAGADFGDIERLAVEYGANVMIGSSDGRRIEDKYDIPLVRCAFPIHDFIGGQRIRTVGYEGSLMLLDRITNVLLHRKETGFRAAIRDEFYDNTLLSNAHNHRDGAGEDFTSSVEDAADEVAALAPVELDLAAKTAQHPCFNGGCASDHARIHLAVAPACNISCNYCVRKYDCVNESRPGVASAVLSPTEALDRFKEARRRIPNLTTVGIAGPGDALANWENTSKTLQLISAEAPQTTFCLSTNGLMLPRYADEIARAGVSHVTVTMNAVTAEKGAPIYKFARVDGITYTGQAAAAVLLSNQIAGIRRLIELGVMVKVNTVLISGVNEDHVEDVARFVTKLGVSYHNVMQHIPVEGSVFGDLPQVSRKSLDQARRTCETYLPQMYHCQQCRADAVGTLFEDLSHVLDEAEGRRHIAVAPTGPLVATFVAKPDDAPKRRGMMRIAVASRSGLMVDAHFGQATSFMIYETNGAIVKYRETREVATYCQGAEQCGSHNEDRLERTLATVQDCASVLCMRIGTTPRFELESRGIHICVTCDAIDAAVRIAWTQACAHAGSKASYEEENYFKKAVSL